jgi:hypothetical protein
LRKHHLSQVLEHALERFSRDVVLANEKSDFFTRNGLFIFFSQQQHGIPLATLLEWYKIRDTFFGLNRVSQNIPLAIELASSCEHPDARWLTEACAGKDVETKEDAKRVFSALGQNDARAVFASCGCMVIWKTSLRCVAQLSSVLLLLKLGWRKKLKAKRSSSLLSWLLLKASVMVLFTGLVGVFVFWYWLRKGFGQGKGKLFACEPTWSCFGHALAWRFA